jgi:B12-binding domain/radical SAM domain protein
MFNRTPDVVFFHPPSIYDFRERPEALGPISDVIPSSPVFEMYPIGITSIADYLEQHGYDVQLINLGYQMLQNPDYDPDEELARSNGRFFAIDLHWLPHAHGALETAKRLKETHPNRPVIFGGISSSYYHEELIEYPFVDYVVRGDSTEEPMLQLVETIERGGDLNAVPNLTWQQNGETMVNPIEFVPDNLDYAALPSYTYVIRSVFKYGSLSKVLPHQNWIDDPMTLLLTSRGCALNCAFCGGSATGYRNVLGRDRPAFRSPETLIEDVKEIQSFSEGPIFVIHDLRMGGDDYANELLERLARQNIDNEFIFELFDTAEPSYFEKLDRATDAYSLELSIESQERKIRKATGKFDRSNEEIEDTLQAALENGCQNIDVFFMVGMPSQTYEDAVGAVDYAEELLAKLDDVGEGSVMPFVAPLAPFLDPGSPAYEQPEKYGYRKLAHSLEDHIEHLLEPSWKRMLTFETEWMTREEIVDATYETARGLNEVKHDYGLIDDESYEAVRSQIDRSSRLVEEVDAIYDLPPEQRTEEFERLAERIDTFGEYSVCGEDELTWSNSNLRDAASLSRLAAKLLWDDVKRRVTSRIR